MQLYAITDRRNLGRTERQRMSVLLGLAAQWASGGVDFIQIREKDLDRARMLEVSRQIAVRAAGSPTRVLLNGPAEIAIEAGADGVHLPSGWNGRSIHEVSRLWRNSGLTHEPIVSVACHSMADAERARADGARLVIFAPVFGKRLETGETLAGAGLAALKAVCLAAGATPVFALGGVTAANAGSCIEVGASGIAAIRLFAADDWTNLRSKG